ncbi:heme utilization cystosolic carrier protein HutX [Rhizobium helianthi]|uniref:Heme utilization cystosolic carrier protein HutX n=1 Tax=Rhizobium helianthi TaxID=1132695 RepID=A0ABW4M0H0_9HYPH
MTRPLSTTVEAEHRLQRARNAVAVNPDGVVEALAAEADVSPSEILTVLPNASVVTVEADTFDAIWAELTLWNEVLAIIQTEDVVLEVTGRLPQGTEGRGWFNIHGDSPIGGHIRKTSCASIAFVDRPFHGRRSCSVWFMTAAGRAMFKIFVPRDEKRDLKQEPLLQFEAMMKRYGARQS